jgi:2-polyprenyl-3-methyl-5-hydroxy-6-metoxy-1,4-benzoquinol methylase
MNQKAHWDKVYSTKPAEAVSWFAPHLETSLKLIHTASARKDAAIIDIGGGESTLVDDLFNEGYRNLSVLDISQTAIEVAKERMGQNASAIQWYCVDIAQASLPEAHFDIWHDRAVFHFLTKQSDRDQYVERVKRSLKHGGYVIMATFGPEGPTQCSDLDVERYDTQELHNQFGDSFELLQSSTEMHQTPMGTTQQFLYCFCRMK